MIPPGLVVLAAVAVVGCAMAGFLAVWAVLGRRYA